MGSRSSSTRRKRKSGREDKLDYRGLLRKLSELEIDVSVKQSEFSRAGKSVKALIKSLLDRLERLEKGGYGGIELTEEEIEYVIYRLRTIYGDPMAASVVAKLTDLLRKRREKGVSGGSAS